MAVLDEPGGNASAQLSAQVHERRKSPYAWACPNCGAANMGYVEDGCPSCGAGKDAIQREPERAVDYQCRACRGQGTVDRKCGDCGATGYRTAPSDGVPAEDCLTCGGAGSVGTQCARCLGGGIDPEPQFAVPAAVIPKVIPPAVGEKVPDLPANSGQAGIFSKPSTLRLDRHLPSLDDPPLTPTPVVVRYRLLRYEGSPEEVDRTLGLSLDGHYSNGAVAITAVEIAPPALQSAATQALDDRKRAGDGVWPARHVFDRKG